MPSSPLVFHGTESRRIAGHSEGSFGRDLEINTKEQETIILRKMNTEKHIGVFIDR